jgi:hypothetical protein
MALDLSALTAEIARDNDVNSSASTLITTLASQLEAAKGDPVAIQAIVDQLRSQNDSLAAAVAANTPGA